MANEYKSFYKKDLEEMINRIAISCQQKANIFSQDLNLARIAVFNTGVNAACEALLRALDGEDYDDD